MSEASCLFCRIARGEIPAKVVHQDDRLVAFRDINPQAPVHILIIPREHIASLNDLAPSHGDLIGAMHVVAAELARAEGFADKGWRVVTNVGADGGQTVAHLHLHLLGGRALHWPPG